MNILGRLLSTVIQTTPVYSDREIGLIIDERRLIDPTMLNEARVLAAQMIGVSIPPIAQFNKADIMNLPEAEAEEMVKQIEEYNQERQVVLSLIDEQAIPIAKKGLIDGLRNPRAGKYYASVSTSANSPSAHFREWSEIIEINQALVESQQPPLPADVLIEASDLRNKEKILERMGAAL